MAEYTPTFIKPYPDGWKDKPDETTPVTAEIMDDYDSAIENIEKYLEDNPISESGGGGGGNSTNLVAENSISMGRTSDSAVGVKSTAIGFFVEASGDNSFATGEDTKATARNTFSQGAHTEASFYGAHAEGDSTKASGRVSHSEGQGTLASSDNQHVQGKYNIEDTQGKYAHIVGGGTSDSNRKNIHTLDWQGNATYAGTVETQGLVLKDTITEQKYVLTIANGNIEITAVE